jgi:hypothetical protein
VFIQRRIPTESPVVGEGPVFFRDGAVRTSSAAAAAPEWEETPRRGGERRKLGGLGFFSSLAGSEAI